MLSTSIQKGIDALFSDYDHPDSPGCVVGICQEGSLVYTHGYGMADLEHHVPMDSHTVFHLASVSKQFTATCIALLEEAGRLSLDDAVSRYIPYLPDCAQKLTLRHLVAMTNGLEDVYETAYAVMGIPEESSFSLDDVKMMVSGISWLKSVPGERWSYGNTGYVLLAQIIGLVAGCPFDQFVKKHIFDPLGMEHTCVRTDGHMTLDNAVKTYTRQRLIRFKEPGAGQLEGWGATMDTMGICGAGQVWSTVEDLSLWEKNYFNNVLGQRDRGLMLRLSQPFRLHDGTPTAYAYGQCTGSRNGERIVYHEGGAPGINTAIYRVVDKRLSVIFLSNSSDSILTLLRKLGQQVYERIADLVVGRVSFSTSASLAEQPEPSSPCAPNWQPDVVEFTGLYRCPALDTSYHVKAGEKALSLYNVRPERDAIDMEFLPTDQDLFAAQYPPVFDRYALRFIRNARGEIEAFVLGDAEPGRENWVFTRQPS